MRMSPLGSTIMAERVLASVTALERLSRAFASSHARRLDLRGYALSSLRTPTSRRRSLAAALVGREVPADPARPRRARALRWTTEPSLSAVAGHACSELHHLRRGAGRRSVGDSYRVPASTAAAGTARAASAASTAITTGD